MLGIRLEPELEDKLNNLAKETGRTKSYYVREAIKRFLEEREDYLLGVSVLERLERGEEKTMSFDEVEKYLGLED